MRRVFFSLCGLAAGSCLVPDAIVQALSLTHGSVIAKRKPLI